MQLKGEGAKQFFLKICNSFEIIRVDNNFLSKRGLE
jgi:hypothetical protein